MGEGLLGGDGAGHEVGAEQGGAAVEGLGSAM